VAVPRAGQDSRPFLTTAALWLIAAAAVGCAGSSEPGPAPAPSRDGPPSAPQDAAPVNDRAVDVAAPADGPGTTTGPEGGTGGSGGQADGGTGGSDGGAGGPDAAPGRDAPTGVVKLMVLGSSNEVGTCWRAFLWQKLRAAGVTNFDFVGSKADGPDCNVPGYDRDDESRNGTIVSDISAAEYNSRFKAHPPDIVLVHFGGADILRGIAPARVIPGYTLMVEQGRAVNPQIRFLVAEHTPMTPASCPECPRTVPQLNAAIVEWSKQITTAAAPVASVDLFTGVDPATDTSDRVHLNIAGAQKVSERWLAALLPIFKP
jgi:acyl-CoA thioesterase I